MSFDNPTYTGTYTEPSMYSETDTNTNLVKHEHITSSASGMYSYQDISPTDMSQYYLDNTNEPSTDTDYIDVMPEYKNSVLTTDF